MTGDADERGGAPRAPCAHVWRSWRASSGREIEDCVRCGERRHPAACGTALPVAHEAPEVCRPCYERVSRLACERRDEIERLKARIATFMRLAHHERGEP